MYKRSISRSSTPPATNGAGHPSKASQQHPVATVLPPTCLFFPFSILCNPPCVPFYYSQLASFRQVLSASGVLAVAPLSSIHSLLQHSTRPFQICLTMAQSSSSSTSTTTFAPMPSAVSTGICRISTIPSQMPAHPTRIRRGLLFRMAELISCVPGVESLR
ncbi:hypothetical protein BDY21DRAFT_57258 [Lineolata rhizophorae]|uniref:Uncharacterized protein n=1 Tax=Lineolata rhizophorae TaxID=578093 RepID=A0A6A6NWM9_9PEZI|nr:hypothetical protein BDY21DRAFT_57258 [Lineolata rhizophorae]